MAKYNLWHMAGLDIFLQSLNDHELKNYTTKLAPKPYLSPLKSWEVSSDFFLPTEPLNPLEKDRTTLEFMESQFQWKTDLSEILMLPYDALIVTDALQTILWTNPGFSKMTGYQANYAIGKKPSFLQGDKTSKESKGLIKENLLKEIPFSSKILNYKKNKKEYWCNIKIFPMQNKLGTSHYLALETELL